jgi:hypothetical protein
MLKLTLKLFNMRKKYFSKLLNKVVTSKEILDYNKSNNFFKNKKLLKIEERYINIQKDMSINIDITNVVQDVVQKVIDKTVLNKHKVLCYYK